MALIANARGDFQEGARWNRRALAWLRERDRHAPNARPMTSVILSNMGRSEFVQGNLPEAERYLNEARVIQQETGFVWAEAETLFILARIAEARGSYHDATRHYHQSLRNAVESHDQALIAKLFGMFAAYAADARLAEWSAMLQGAGDRLLELLGYEQESGNLATPNNVVALDWYQAGHAMTVTQAMSLALQIDVPPPQVDGLARYNLTAREREVLALVAESLTDREIADHLSISLRTVNAHVASVLAKMQVSSRRQAATIARSSAGTDTGVGTT
jgi:DNA-binding CsgD family transcriptional regulator